MTSIDHETVSLLFDKKQYCLNNPIMYTDPTGTIGVFAIIAIAVGIVAAVAIDHHLAKRVNKEKNYVKHKKISEKTEAKLITGSGSGFTSDANGVTLVDTTISLASVETIDKDNGFNGTIHAGNATATASVDWSGKPAFGLSAVAAAGRATASKTFHFGTFDLTVTADRYWGAGAEIEFDFEEMCFKAGAANGWGGGIELDWDFHVDS